jgi:elongation factor Ts
MAEITAASVAALRKATGAGMMDCKRALEESDGDLDVAKDLLRTQGLAGASKREGREANQGAIDVRVDGGVAALVELNCETDFVAKGADFTDLLADLTGLVLAGHDADLGDAAYNGSTAGEAVTQLGSKVGEKIELGRVARFETSDGIVDAYKHLQTGRGIIGVLVELSGVDAADARVQEVAHEVALHIASAAPRWTRRDEVPADVLDKEREIFEELTRNEGKPEQAIPKIVEGRIGGFYRDNVLVEQTYVRDAKITIADLVAGLGGDATVRRFARVKIGEE